MMVYMQKYIVENVLLLLYNLFSNSVMTAKNSVLLFWDTGLAWNIVYEIEVRHHFIFSSFFANQLLFQGIKNLV